MRWFSWHHAASPFRIRQPWGWRSAASGDGHLRVCCLQLLVSSFCWRSSGQHCSNQASCCRRVVHWAASSWPLLTQPWREAWGGREQPGSSLWLWRWAWTAWTPFVSLLEVVMRQDNRSSYSNEQHTLDHFNLIYPSSKL